MGRTSVQRRGARQFAGVTEERRDKSNLGGIEIHDKTDKKLTLLFGRILCWVGMRVAQPYTLHNVSICEWI